MEVPTLKPTHAVVQKWASIQRSLVGRQPFNDNNVVLVCSHGQEECKVEHIKLIGSTILHELVSMMNFEF